MAAVVMVGIAGAAALLPWILLLGTRPRLEAPAAQLPVGDAMRVVGHQVRGFGGAGWSDSVRRDSEGALGRLYTWRVEAAPEGLAGEARIDARGVLTGVRPGRVRVRGSVLRRSDALDVDVVPRMIEFGATPSAVTVRVDDHVPVYVRARLDGGAPPASWVATITLPPPGLDLALGIPRPQPVAVADTARYAPAAGAWVIDVAGRDTGNTTLRVRLGARELVIPVTVVGARR